VVFRLRTILETGERSPTPSNVLFPRCSVEWIFFREDPFAHAEHPVFRSFIDEIYATFDIVVFGCSRMKAETTLGTRIDSVVGKLLETW
jgi:hypothetical protein